MAETQNLCPKGMLSAKGGQAIKYRSCKRGIRIRKFLFCILYVSFFIFHIPLCAASAESSSSISKNEIPSAIIIPFAIHSEEDLSGLRRALLNTIAATIEEEGVVRIGGVERLKKLVLEENVYLFDEAVAIRLGKEENIQFAILGSITKVGRHISLDIKLINVSSGRILGFLHVRREDREELLETAAGLSKDIQNKILQSMDAKEKFPVAAKSQVIDRIRIDGNRRVDDEAILTKLKSKEGALLFHDELRDDIKAIYDMGFFEDVMADVTDTTAGTVLTFAVKERPVIKKVEISGNKEISTEKISAGITVKENTILNRTLIAENVEKIKALYAAEGFYLSKVEPVVEQDGASVSVKFEIEEGEKVRVQRITIIGNAAFDEDEIEGLMDTSEVGLFSFLTKSGIFNEAVFQNDLNKITAHYYDNGYIHARITDHLVSMSSDKRWFFITIALHEGDQYKIGKIDISGDMITTKTELMEKVKLEPGDIFSRKRLNEDITVLSDRYGDEGYANVNINPVINVDEQKKTMDITFDIQKGELVYIERINISGNVNTRDKVIRREVELSEGLLFSATGLKRSRNNLRRLGYFEDVNITTAPGSSDNRMTLNVDVKERPTGSISAGVGYSSVDKIIGTASISQSNFLGTGLKLNITGTFSSKTERYNLGFTEPWLFDKPISAGFDLFKSTREYPDFTRGSYGFDIRSGFPVYGKDVRGYLTYKLEEVTIKDVAAGASETIKEQEGKTTTSSIEAVLRRDTRNDAFYPSEGSVTSLSVEFAGGPLRGDNNFVKYVGEGIKYFPLWWDSTFSVRGVIGYVQGFGGKKIPIYERFYLGGINTLRGFRTRSIGPRDPATNEVIGGDKELFANFEYLFPLVEAQKIKGLIFYDAGNAYDRSIDLSDLRTSAGVGIRWFSPVGPLRLEWGYNLDREDGEKSSQWEFTIGTVF